MADVIKVPLPSKPKPEKPGCECSGPSAHCDGGVSSAVPALVACGDAGKREE